MKNKTGNPLFHKLLLESTFVGIDRQLYAKYGLSEEEITFIEKMINPME